jgi:crotonobetainyl-CoA:carnitine CoA-transferase CaiB-like acyl-CoA transferase
MKPKRDQGPAASGKLPDGALTGLTVVDLTRLLPGPYCSMILADHGARVISVEDPRHTAGGRLVTPVQRNKAHVSLNLKSDAGRRIFLELTDRADVVLEGFRPGVAHRLGVDYETVSRRNPAIVYCAISGYGQTGPLRDRAGHDINFLAESGVLDLMGEAGRPPAIPGIQIADMAAGGMSAAIGVLMALLARRETGRGQFLDVAMADGMLAMLPTAVYLSRLTGRPPARGDGLLAHRYACYNVYETADGRYLAVGAVENRFWRNLCRRLGLPQYARLQFDDARRHEIIAAMRDRFRRHALDEWERRLSDLDVCCSPVRRMEEALTAGLFQQREMVRDPDPATGAPELGVPIKLSDTPGGLRTPAAEFGADTESVLESLGYRAEQIAEFRRQGIV